MFQSTPPGGRRLTSWLEGAPEFVSIHASGGEATLILDDLAAGFDVSIHASGGEATTVDLSSLHPGWVSIHASGGEAT